MTTPWYCDPNGVVLRIWPPDVDRLPDVVGRVAHHATAAADIGTRVRSSVALMPWTGTASNTHRREITLAHDWIQRGVTQLEDMVTALRAGQRTCQGIVEQDHQRYLEHKQFLASIDPLGAMTGGR
jgi:hypothetical protein